MAIKPTDYVVNVSKLPNIPMDMWPAFWMNFQRHIEKNINWSVRYNGDRVGDEINKYLRNIDAEMKHNKKNEIIVKFKSEADFLIFKMRWL